MTEDAIGRLLLSRYGLAARSLQRAASGVGADTFFAACDEGRYVVKLAEANVMNHPELEPALCARLRARGVSAPVFLRAKDGGFLTEADGRLLHVQAFIEGKTYAPHRAPDWLLDAMARTLGDIHTALSGEANLPVGIGAGFFAHMTPERALASYRETLAEAKRRGDAQIADDLAFRVELLSRFPDLGIDVARLSCRATHGDYTAAQILCGESGINAVIDWTSACVHPVVWEIMRSYVYAAPTCETGAIDAAGLARYIGLYRERAPLSAFDIAMLPRVFYYQIAVCDYYAQYYRSTAVSREQFLWQATFSTRMMRWLDERLDELTEALLQ